MGKNRLFGKLSTINKMYEKFNFSLHCYQTKFRILPSNNPGNVIQPINDGFTIPSKLCSYATIQCTQAVNINFASFKKTIYSRHYAEVCGGAHLYGLTPPQHSYEETSQRWRAVGKTVSDLIGPGIEPNTSCTVSTADYLVPLNKYIDHINN